MARNVTDNIYIKWEEKEQWWYVFLAMDNKENVEIFRSEVDCQKQSMISKLIQKNIELMNYSMVVTSLVINFKRTYSPGFP